MLYCSTNRSNGLDCGDLMKVKTGIAGLDELMEGGFNEGSTNLISGPPGSGKSLFGMQYIYNGAKMFDENGIYVTIEEGADTVRNCMDVHGMDIESFMSSGKVYLIDLGESTKTSASGARRIRGFETLSDFLENLLKLSKAKRIVIDSIDSVGVHYKSPDELRLSLYKFLRFLKENQTTSILIGEGIGGKSRYGVEEYVCDGYLEMDLKEVENELVRSMMVRKLRFGNHDRFRHKFDITREGIVIKG